jgi:hypothetical protein
MQLMVLFKSNDVAAARQMSGEKLIYKRYRAVTVDL